MKHIFGPVPSRRLGLSLGLDIIPFKTCTLDCIYCECGPTTEKTLRRKKYVRTRELVSELENYLARGLRPDYITFSGSGEPTLNTELGKMICQIKKRTAIPVAVLTNGTLLYKKSVRKDLQQADLVKPSLDAVLFPTFMRINRPHRRLKLSRIIQGLIKFRKEFKGQIWLELFLIKNVNDSDHVIGSFIPVLRQISPDRLQLNTIDRPPAEPSARSLSRERMEQILMIFKNAGFNAEIIRKFKKEALTRKVSDNNSKEQILNLIKRRPETIQNIASGLSLDIRAVHHLLLEMQKEGLIESVSRPDSGEPCYRIRTGF